jgi:hypothetical protein
MKASSWRITHDPLRLSDVQTNLAQLEEAAREQGEDVIQASSGSRTLDLGWYGDRYLVLLVEGENWSTPIQQVEALDLKGALAAFKSLSI